jgi:hypothetical protein
MPKMAATKPVDFSAQLDTLWNIAKPADSEARFRTELARYPAGSREALEGTTQIARTQGLQRKFAEANATLDTVAPKLDTVPSRVRRTTWASSSSMISGSPTCVSQKLTGVVPQPPEPVSFWRVRVSFRMNRQCSVRAIGPPCEKP